MSRTSSTKLEVAEGLAAMGQALKDGLMEIARCSVSSNSNESMWTQQARVNERLLEAQEDNKQVMMLLLEFLKRGTQTIAEVK